MNFRSVWLIHFLDMSFKKGVIGRTLNFIRGQDPIRPMLKSPSPQNQKVCTMRRLKKGVVRVVVGNERRHPRMPPLFCRLNGGCAVENTFKFAAASRMSKFTQCFCLDLTNPLTSNVVLPANFLQGSCSSRPRGHIGVPEFCVHARSIRAILRRFSHE